MDRKALGFRRQLQFAAGLLLLPCILWKSVNEMTALFCVCVLFLLFPEDQ